LDVGRFPLFFVNPNARFPPMNSTDWIKRKSATTLHPAQVQNTLESLAENWPADAPTLRDLLEQFPLGENSLLHLLSVSSICAARLVLHPNILLWISRPEICSEPRSHRAMLTDLQRIGEGSTFSASFEALRYYAAGAAARTRSSPFSRSVNSGAGN